MKLTADGDLFRTPKNTVPLAVPTDIKPSVQKSIFGAQTIQSSGDVSVKPGSKKITGDPLDSLEWKKGKAS